MTAKRKPAKRTPKRRAPAKRKVAKRAPRPPRKLARIKANMKKAEIVFKDAKGRYVAKERRYTTDVATVWAKRKGMWVMISDEPIGPEDLVQLVSMDEFDSLPPALKPVATVKRDNRMKYVAWNLAKRIDKTKGIRRKLIKYTLNIRDGVALRKIPFFHTIRKNGKASWQIFERINETISAEGMATYKTLKGEAIPDRKGKKEIKLESIDMEEIL
jgi:hypothetical protein